MPRVSSRGVSIPSISSPTRPYEFNDYSKGINTYLANDKVPLKDGDANYWRLAQDARMPTLGEYETRRGADFHSAAVGETIDVQQTSTTGAADQSFNETTRIAKKITFTTTGRCTRLDLNLKNAASATGTVIIELYSNSSGAPGTLLAKSSIASSAIGTSYDYETVRFINAPSVTATDYWVVVYVQATATNSYSISSTTNASTGLTSSNSGTSWSAASKDFNVKAYLATNGATKGLARYVKNDGTKVTIIWAGTAMYSVNESTGALTTIKSGLNASATKYRWIVVNDILYYVNEYDGYRKWNGTTETQVSSTNYSNLCEHKGLVFLVRTDDKQRVDFTNFADYETITSTDFIYVPSPKTGDPVTAVASVNGLLMLWTLKSKFILSGDDNANFQLYPALGKKGTYSQETMALSGNYAYFLSDDSIYRTNGTGDEPLSENIYEDIRQLPNKDEAVLNINRGRLRIFYAPAGEFDCIESFDTDTYFSFAYTSAPDEDKLFVASSLVGQVYYEDLDTNDYTNLGGDLDFELRTHYMHFGSPANYKEARYWKPRLESQSGNYRITCQYSVDLRDSATTFDTPSVQGEGAVWGSATWGSFTWGTTPELQPDLSVPGEHRRIQIRYLHHATRQPHKFLGHTFVVETRRLR